MSKRKISVLFIVLLLILIGGSLIFFLNYRPRMIKCSNDKELLDVLNFDQVECDISHVQTKFGQYNGAHYTDILVQLKTNWKNIESNESFFVYDEETKNNIVEFERYNISVEQFDKVGYTFKGYEEMRFWKKTATSYSICWGINFDSEDMCSMTVIATIPAIVQINIDLHN